MKKRQIIMACLIAMACAASTTAMAQPKHHFDSKNPDVHDPVMAVGEDGRYYVFSTGMGIGVMSSQDLKTWREEKPVFQMPAPPKRNRQGRFEPDEHWGEPQWAVDSIKGFHGHIWAPDISYQNGLWHIYYSCSTFGKNGSAIGLATNRTLNPQSPDFKWEDQGAVVVSHKHQDNWNAIDPNLAPLPYADARENDSQEGRHLFWGSFWDGIQMARLNADLHTLATKPVTVARRTDHSLRLKDVDNPEAFTVEGGDTIEAGENAIEAPFVIYNRGWYYLFVSWDYCCRGRNSTYKTVYGRSRNVEGPYLDKNGKDMAYGGGTLLVGPDDKYYGVGHCSAYSVPYPMPTSEHPDPARAARQWFFVSHAYDISQKGQSKLFIRPLLFDADGWLSLGEL